MRGKKTRPPAPGDVTLWHATVHLNLDGTSFHPLSHFGTRKAAIERVSNVIHKRGWQYRPDMFSPDLIGGFPLDLHPVRLDIASPLTISDQKEERHSARGIVDFLYYRKKLLSADQRDSVSCAFDSGDTIPDPVAIVAQMAKEAEALALLVRGLGHDGFVYENACEDRGSLAWIVLDPDQVASAGPVERMTLEEAVAEWHRLDDGGPEIVENNSVGRPGM